jgi:glycine betaine/proline transport system permease protein
MFEGWEMPRIPIGRWMDGFIQGPVDRYLGWFFDLLQTVFRWVLGNLQEVLLWPPSLVWIAVLTLMAWRVRGKGFALFTLVAFLLIDGMGQWSRTMQTLALIVVATLLAVSIAVPVGIAAARSRRVSYIVRPVLDFMQTLPPFVYLVPVMFLMGTGTPPGLLATLVFAIPPGVRLAELGIRGVDKEVVEAAEAFGATKRQILWKVQVPLALPSIMQGVNQVIMLALSMVVVAALIGSQSLGTEVVRSLSTLNIGLGFESGFAVVILAIFLDRMTSVWSDRAKQAAA